MIAADLSGLPATIRDQRIMALCDQAILNLGEARTIEEVQRVGDMAAAFAAYARKIKAAMAAQNATQSVVLLAEARIGSELKAAQERGELGAQGRRPNFLRDAEEVSPAIGDLGISYQRASEMRKLSELGPAAIQHAVDAATEADEPITRRAMAVAQVALRDYSAQARQTGEPVTDKGVRAAIRAAVIGILPPRPERRPEDAAPRRTAAEKQLADDWIDWISAVEKLAAIGSNAEILWRHTPSGLHNKLRQEAIAAAPRLQAWLNEMEKQNNENN